MMAEIIRELIAIQKTNEITSEQVLVWLKRVQAQRAQKALTETIKERKEVDDVKMHE